MIGMTATDQVIGKEGRNFTGFFGLGTGLAHTSKYSGEIRSFSDAVKGFEQAEGTDAQIAAMQVLLEQVEQLSMLKGGISGQEEKLIQLIKEQADILLGIKAGETARDARRQREVDETVRGYSQQAEVSAAILKFGEDSAEVETVRARQAREALKLRLQEMGVIAGSVQEQDALAALEADLAASADLRAQARQKESDALIADLTRQGELSAAILRFGEDSAEVEALRARHAREVNDERLKEMGLAPGLLALAQQLFAAEQKRTRQIRDGEAGRKADEMVADLREQAEINRAIALHGRDSLQVKELLIAAERRPYAASLESLKVSEARKREMMAEWDLARGMASADPFGQIAATREMQRAQAERLQQLKLEQALLGQSEAVRSRILALWKAELEIRRQGIDAASERAQEIRAAAFEEDALTRSVERQKEAWSSVQSAAETAIDGIIDSLMKGDIEGAFEALASDITGMFAQLAISNPMKNAILGTDHATMADVGGLEGIWARLTGRGDGSDVQLPGPVTDVGTMSVEAANVVIGGPGAMSLLAGSGAANANFAPGIGGGLSGSSDVQSQVWKFFAGKGLQPHQIAGIMGNIQGESGFNPFAVGDNGTSFGLFQHHAGRGQGLLNAVGGSAGLGDVQKQLEFVWRELMTSESGAMQRLLASKDVGGATDAWMRGFERPSNEAMIDSWGTRLGAAEQALTQFSATAQTTTADLGTLGGGMGAFGNALQGFAQGGPQGALNGLLGGIGQIVASAIGIPGFAFGGDFGGGVRIVGEKGPELEFTGPSRIMNAELTRQLLSSRNPAMAANTPAQPVVQIQPVLVNNTSRPFEVETEETTDARGQRQTKYVLSEMTSQGIGARGGAAARTLRGMGVGTPTRRRG